MKGMRKAFIFAAAGLLVAGKNLQAQTPPEKHVDYARLDNEVTRAAYVDNLKAEYNRSSETFIPTDSSFDQLITEAYRDNGKSLRSDDWEESYSFEYVPEKKLLRLQVSKQVRAWKDGQYHYLKENRIYYDANRDGYFDPVKEMKSFSVETGIKGVQRTGLRSSGQELSLFSNDDLTKHEADNIETVAQSTLASDKYACALHLMVASFSKGMPLRSRSEWKLALNDPVCKCQ